MFRSVIGRAIVALLAVLIALASTSASHAQPVRPGFATIERELRLMHENNLFKGGKSKEGEGKGDPVRFDTVTAKKRNYSKESIVLGEQLAALTNELTASMSAEQPGIRDGQVDISKYPAVAAYFQDATAAIQATEGVPQGQQEANGLSASPEGIRAQPTFVTGQLVCGWYTNPKPNANKAWRWWSNSNPDELMRSWGYHATSGLVGGGWTRPQTWNSWACGWGTYRDHAYNYGNAYVVEQNYDGWSPRGEPNPEVYLSGPWPYSDWPAYVYWWHTWGPGR